MTFLTEKTGSRWYHTIGGFPGSVLIINFVSKIIEQRLLKYFTHKYNLYSKWKMPKPIYDVRDLEDYIRKELRDRKIIWTGDLPRRPTLKNLHIRLLHKRFQNCEQFCELFTKIFKIVKDHSLLKPSLYIMLCEKILYIYIL